MNNDSIVILGVPVDNLDLEESLSHLFSMSRSYDEDGRPRLAVAVTAETIMYLRASTNHTDTLSSLFKTLRNADILIPLSLSIAWAAKILGIKFKKQISDRVFFKKFLENAIIQGQNVVLIKKTINSDHPEKNPYECFPLTRTTPFESDKKDEERFGGGSQKHPVAPMPHGSTTAGLELMHDMINSAGIDFLIIDIKDPDVATWFATSGNLIHVPVILLLTGTHALSGATNGILIDGKSTKRLNSFKHLYHNYVALGLRILPLMIYQKYNQAIFNLRHQRSIIPFFKSASPQSTGGMIIRVISMPDPLDASITEDIRFKIRQMSQASPKIVLDFSRVNFMDSSGLGLLMGLCRTSSAENREIFLIGIKLRIYNFFKLSRTMDFFEDRIMQNLPDVLAGIKRRISNSSFYYLAVIRSAAVVFNFYGKLDATAILDINTESLMEQMDGKDIILNLAEIDFADGAGIRLLVRLHRQASKNDRILIVCSMKRKVRQMISIFGLDSLFLTERDLASAELTLRRRQISKMEKDTFSHPSPKEMPGMNSLTGSLLHPVKLDGSPARDRLRS